ncbi:MAG: hypothetical protein ACJ762_03140 [Solirubrobacteraceae bacterium]
MRKLTLPLLAAVAMFAVSAPVASAKPVKAHTSASLGSKLSQVSGALKGLQKALNQMKDINSGQTGAINGVDNRVTAVVAGLDSLGKKVDAIVAVATDSLTKLQAGLVSLAAAVQGAGVAGQLGAAGTAAPGAANTATPAALPTGTVYRQIVLSSASLGPLPAGTPVGARTYVKNPDVAGLYSNSWTCVGAGVSNEVFAASGGAASVSCTAHTP